jgi:hypothetical protein
MTIQLKDGGTYARADGTEYKVQPRCHDHYSWIDEGYETYTNEGRYSRFERTPHDLIRVVSEPSEAPVDPIAHLFEVVPEQRKFIGGEVFPAVYLRRCTMGTELFYIENNAGAYIAVNSESARILAAALNAVADLDNEH